MNDRARRTDFLLAAAAVWIPVLTGLSSMSARTAFRPDLAGIVISIVILVAATGAGYAALRRYGNSENT